MEDDALEVIALVSIIRKEKESTLDPPLTDLYFERKRPRPPRELVHIGSVHSKCVFLALSTTSFHVSA
jgi:hypothetical protein